MQRVKIIKKTTEYPDNKKGKENNEIVTYEGLFSTSSGREVIVNFDDEFNIVTPGILILFNQIKLSGIRIMLTEISRYLTDEHRKKVMSNCCKSAKTQRVAQ